MKEKIFWWFCIVLWCGLIFFMSNQKGDDSSNLSLCVANLLNRWLGQLFGPGVPALSEDLVRKCAHFFEYFVLGCLLFRGFLDRARQGRVILLVFVSGFLFAVSDEVHQLFIPGRTMRPFDVFVDLAGIAAAVLLVRQRLFRPRLPLR